ncbi:MAG: N-6 DNA methylase, partial [Ghiorsea sp.]|nr:N-6 DNA methylase [Ghiorsea sp.]
MNHIPLFQTNLLKLRLGELMPIPDAHLQILQRWQTAFSSGRLNKIKEISLHGEFLTDLFGHVLGYHGITSAQDGIWHVQAEVSIVGAGQADAGLGFLSEHQSRLIAPLELKGAMTSLDHTMSRGYTPVQQAWRYANAIADCRWVLVSNYRELRLYATNRTPSEYESFEISKLTEPAEYWRLQLLLSKDNFLAGDINNPAPSHTDKLLEASGAAEKAITKRLYNDYRSIRSDLFQQLVAHNPTTDDILLISAAQKILDRVLFIAFAEDVGLLPHNILLKAFESSNAFNPTPIWSNFQGLFQAVDKGNAALNIPRYNGGLFAPDALLDGLALPDAACEHFKSLAAYDFASEISVTVLGHIFEQSITDLEAMKGEAQGEKSLGKRKTDGVFYTPDAITRFIVEETIGGYLKQKFEALQAAQTGRTSKKRDITFWETYRDEVLRPLKVCDPACGSGAFLVAAFDYLHAEYRRVADALHDLTGGYSLFDLNKTILTENLFVVDINPESVEISKLSLWLKTAEQGKPLTSLDANIQQGNSLLDSAFNWQQSFPTIFAQGGFDIILGNPPYVRQELIKHYKADLQKDYAVYHGVADLYAYFFERGINLLKTNGRLGYISSSTFFKTAAGKPLREFLSLHTTMETIVDFGDMQVFEGATTYPAILIMQKVTEPKHQPITHVQTRSHHEVAFVDVLKMGKKTNLAAVLTAPRSITVQSSLSDDGWRLEDKSLATLRAKLMCTGKRLKENFSIKRGMTTGFNEAFVIDRQTKDRLIAQGAQSTLLLKPFLEGKDLKPWHIEPRDLWLIRIPKGWTREQSSFTNETEAWLWMQQHHPAISQWLETFSEKAKKRSDKGEFWWELRTCKYYPLFESSKVV